MNTPASTTPVPVSLISLSLNGWDLTLTVSIWLAVAAAVLVFLAIIYRWQFGGLFLKDFEIDGAEIGTGVNKMKFKPNMTDRQVAYAIWVELSTRKIGLEIDFEHDVIIEVYDSWFNYFTVTRELIKGIPVSKVRTDSTQKIIKISIEVLNEGLRPHLTKWQARFRQWYQRELRKYETDTSIDLIDPQELQQKFPKYAELKAEMEQVNMKLIRYRAKMRELVMND